MRYIRYVSKHGPELGAAATLSFVAAVELALGLGTMDHSVDHITRPAARAFLLVAAVLVWSIVRIERRQFSGGYHEQ